MPSSNGGYRNTFGEERIIPPLFDKTIGIEVPKVLRRWFFGAGGSASVSGKGALIILGLAGMIGLASISSDPGHQIASGQKATISSTVISGDGTLAPVGTKAGFSITSISGKGFASGIGLKSMAGIAGPISANGSQVAVGAKGIQAGIGISGGGSQATFGTKRGLFSPRISGEGLLTAIGKASGGEEHFGIAFISSNGGLCGIGIKQAFDNADISGEGNLSSVSVKGGMGMATISDNGFLTASGILKWIWKGTPKTTALSDIGDGIPLSSSSVLYEDQELQSSLEISTAFSSEIHAANQLSSNLGKKIILDSTLTEK